MNGKHFLLIIYMKLKHHKMSDNKIKITPEQLKEIISEEAIKHKKRLVLQKQKDVILSQLNEIEKKNK